MLSENAEHTCHVETICHGKTWWAWWHQSKVHETRHWQQYFGLERRTPWYLLDQYSKCPMLEPPEMMGRSATKYKLQNNNTLAMIKSATHHLWQWMHTDVPVVFLNWKCVSVYSIWLPLNSMLFEITQLTVYKTNVVLPVQLWAKVLKT